MKEQLKIFKDVVPDAYPSDFEPWEDPLPENAQTVVQTCHYLLPLGVRKD